MFNASTDRPKLKTDLVKSIPKYREQNQSRENKKKKKGKKTNKTRGYNRIKRARWNRHSISIVRKITRSTIYKHAKTENKNRKIKKENKNKTKSKYIYNEFYIKSLECVGQSNRRWQDLTNICLIFLCLFIANKLCIYMRLCKIWTCTNP